MKPLKVINLFSGPCGGKSTTAAGLFYKMKLAGFEVELVTEYAKELVYDNRLNDMLDRQEYIFAKQHTKIHRLRGKVDWVITDSPLLLSYVYAQDTWRCVNSFRSLVLDTVATYDNINLYLNRPDIYQEYGRNHNREEANEIDQSILTMLQNHAPDTLHFDVNHDIVDTILNDIVGIPSKMDASTDMKKHC